jgi:dihydrodipicolinate synthase/N-acetylneuraminate lyase
MTGREFWGPILRRGVAIPAHPLALTAARRLDERRQRALTRYYLDAGAGGIAVGVHTTQFAIRDPRHGLFAPVLALAAETARDWQERHPGRRPPVLVAGIAGPTRQATAEARLARDLGYHVGLLGLGALAGASDRALIEHARIVGRDIPLMGFYLQPAVGGRVLSYEFWRRFVELDSVVAIKIAPFNRYATLDVVRAVAEAGRRREIALYTGNDDSIVADLLSAFPVRGPARRRSGAVRIAGGLLGHWAFWTRRAVALLERIHRLRRDRRPGGGVPAGLLGLGAQITDANGAIFDAVHQFRGCLPGIHEILRRQGLLRGRWCLDPREDLSPGQAREIDRVCAAYPHLADDGFVRRHLDEWLR